MFSQIDFQNSIQFKRAVGWERGRAFAVKWADLKYLKYINAVFWKHPGRLSSRHQQGSFHVKSLFFVSNIKTQTNDICACEKVSGKILLPEKNFNIPQMVSHSGFWIQKIFSETLFGASRVSRNING